MKDIRCADCGHLNVSEKFGVECQAPLPFWADATEPRILGLIEVLKTRTCDAFEKREGGHE